MKNPFPKFEEEVERRKRDFIDTKLENELFGNYVASQRMNLTVFRNRLNKVLHILQQDEKFQDTASLFIIKRDQVELEYNMRSDIVPKMSPILLQIFIEVLQGSF